MSVCIIYILLTKTTTTQSVVALSYHRMRGLYFLPVVFVATLVIVNINTKATVTQTSILGFNLI